MGPLMLKTGFSARIDDFSLHVEFEASPDEIVAVVGPNGAGKSTLLRTLAGIRPMDEGFLSVDDSLWEETATGTIVQPEDRSVGYVPQSGLLFPHMTVEENVAFGVDNDPALAATVLERLGLEGLESALPHSLSGGQTQLVALARALVRQPRVLLLDEPLASVDVAQRSSIRRHIRRQLRERAGYRLLVTHDPVEAAALADRVIVLDGGRITQTGSIDDLRTRPRSEYVAELVGMNFLRGNANAGVLELTDGRRVVSASDLNGPAIATIHPRAISLYRGRPDGSPRNVWECSVAAIEPNLDRIRVHVTGAIDLIAEVTPGGAAAFTEGMSVWVTVKATEVELNSA